ncbi:MULTISPECIES: GIY-YIG nuclease family protein [unclassified Blastococcus]
MSERLDDAVARFLRPEQLWKREEVLRRPCPIPAVPGVYGWWFDKLPASMDVSACRRFGDRVLLYTGISPKRPPMNGRPPSRGQLRQRIKTHYTNNAEGSTLRKTLGCLLADELGIQLRRVGSGNRRTFVDGEHDLSAWMAAHARVSFIAHERPWELEDELIKRLDLPLNLEGNAHNAFHPELTRVRKLAVEAANALPVLPNPGRRSR